MLEPWVSSWSRIIYRRLHHERFDTDTADWTFPETGPLSGANGALPWIIFERDRRQFDQEFPEFSIERIQPSMPFRYLVSGGVSMRSLMPGVSTFAWRLFERLCEPLMKELAMFSLIKLRRI
jgi:hypothetical protein